MVDYGAVARKHFGNGVGEIELLVQAGVALHNGCPALFAGDD